MKRRKMCCMIISIIISSILLTVTLPIIKGAEIVIFYFNYVYLMCIISEGIYKLIEHGITKESMYETLTGVFALLAIISIVFSLRSNEETIKNILAYVCAASCVIFLIAGAKMYKYTKDI